MTYKNGDKIAIRWENGSKVGQGVYTWDDGTEARVTSKANHLLFDLPLIFPVDDYRSEYAGGFLMKGPVMHGEGTLTTRSGKTFAGQWVNGRMKTQDLELLREENDWLKQKEEEEEERN